MIRARGVLPSLLLSLAVVGAAAALPLTPAERDASNNYVHGLQNSDGGYRPTAAPAPSQLGSVPSAVRVLKYFGGQPRNREAVVRFVMSCYDRAGGGFANTPGGTPDVRTTAMGLMALTELKAPLPNGGKQIVAYFDKNAKSLPEIYIAAAALYGANLKAQNTSQWLETYHTSRRGDGTYGETAADTARAVNAILRMHGTLRDREAIVRTIRESQRPDGGFSATGGSSDLGTTYPVMRAFYMLKERPELARLRGFIARCRNSDGGYGARPGEPSTGSATYQAAIVLHWAEEMEKWR